MSDVEQRIGPYLITGDRGRRFHVITMRDASGESYQGTTQLVLTDLQISELVALLYVLASGNKP